MRRPQRIRRREFLGRVCEFGSVGLAGLLLGRWPSRAAGEPLQRESAPSKTGGRGIMLGEVTVSEFAEHLGSSFRLHTDAGAAVNVELVEATALSAHSPAGEFASRREPFTLLFRGPAEPLLPQMIYALEHPALGRFELFLVPIGPDTKGMRYEAVFN